MLLFFLKFQSENTLMKYSIRYLLPLLVFVLLSLVCKNAKHDQDNFSSNLNKPQNTVDISIPGSFVPASIIVFDSSAIPVFINNFPAFSKIKNDLLRFYKKRNYSYAWFDNSGMIEPAFNLYNRIINIKDDGLPDKFLYKNQLIDLVETNESNPTVSPQLELMLTSQYLSYAKFSWSGLSKEKLMSVNWYLPRKETSYSTLLDSILNEKDILKDVPVYRQYDLLKSYLKKYYDIQAKGGWDKIISLKKNYKVGDTANAIGKIRAHLFLTGEINDDNGSNVYDSILQISIKQLQRQFGYKENSIITSALIAELNKPVEQRIEQIIVNMERCRWVPVQLSTDYLLINIPEYKVHIYENDSLAWSMKIVVGKNKNRTAVFNGELKYIVFSPYWNVPTSILQKEILPAIKRNSNYLNTMHMEWNGQSVRQLPGPWNALGLVKFLFPNSHSIYLHDTPSKYLFNEDKRAFSHGCIRVAEAKRLAQYLLRKDSDWDENKITEAMNKGVERYVTLKKTIPVFIAYFTAWVDENGKLQFRNDIYNRDSKLAKMILEKPLL